MTARVLPGERAGRAEVAVYADARRVAEQVARVVVDEARRAVAKTGCFYLALSGGSTPRPVYEALARPPFSADMPWDRTHVFWGDERCVPPGDARSNEAMARDRLLRHVPISEDRVHPMGCRGEDAARTAVRYEALLRTMFPRSDGALHEGLDVILLGLGEDGHTASLFLGSAALDETERWVAVAHGGELTRVTLTAPFINLSGLVVFMVTGAAKAPAVRQVLEHASKDADALPAGRIRPVRGRLLWLLDQAAAGGPVAASAQEE
jgi:6-phosphogluconolactonase